MSRLEDLITNLCPNGVLFRRLDECCTLEKGKTPIQKAVPGEYPLVVTTSERKSANNYQFEEPTVCIPLVSSRGHGVASLNAVYYQEGKFALGNILCGVTPFKKSGLTAKFLYYYLNLKKDQLIVPLMKGGANVSLTVNVLKTVRVPIPPVEVQIEIINLIDKFSELISTLQAELQARKKQYEYYRDSLLSYTTDAPEKRLGDTCIMKSGKAIKSFLLSNVQDNEHRFPCFGGNGIRGYIAMPSHHGEYPIIGRQGALCGNVNYATGDFYATEHAVVVQTNGEYDNRYLFHLLTSMKLNQYKSQGAQPGLAVGNIENLLAPVPPLDEQKRIAAILDRFDVLCNDLSSGLPAEIQARQKQYEYYRDKLLTFPPLS